MKWKKTASKVCQFSRCVPQLTYAAMLDRLIQEENLNSCHECVIQHPSQREHSCLMMDSEEVWLSYHDEVREKIDANDVLKKAIIFQRGMGNFKDSRF